ncbi:MAG: efflux RND transporter periplasmic adaptor subunit [Pirellula sp.]|jgi:RND family efflux transporter MFP subunit
MPQPTSVLWLQRLRSAFRIGSLWLFVATGAIAVAAMLFWASGTFHPKVHRQLQDSMLPIPTNAHRLPIHTVSIPRYETAVGTIQAVHEAAVASKILARVEEVNVTAGQKVRAGEILVRLLDQDLRAKLGQVDSNLVAAQARQAQAETEFQRAQGLLAQSAISLSEKQARDADLRLANAEVERATQAIEEAKIQLSFATIAAPFDGVVVDKQVKAGDTAVPGQILFRIYDPTQMQLVAQVRESLAMTLRPGQKLTASLDALGFETQATISEVVPQSNSSTHSFEVKVIGPVPEGIYSGMFGRLKLPLGTEDAILVPKSSITHIGQLSIIYIAHENRMERRNVQVGRELGDQVQILAGLRSGETIIVRATTDRIPTPGNSH